jgi:hypothetical protein
MLEFHQRELVDFSDPAFIVDKVEFFAPLTNRVEAASETSTNFRW